MSDLILYIAAHLINFAIALKIGWIWRDRRPEPRHAVQPQPADTPWVNAWRKDFDAKCDEIRAEIHREANPS